MRKKIIFYSLVLILLSLAPITALKVTPWAVVEPFPSSITNLVQRLFGLTAFTLLFIQIFVYEFGDKLKIKFNGLITWIFVLGSQISFLLFNYFLSHTFDPFYVFVDFCVLCSPNTEYFITLFRISFWLVTVCLFWPKLKHLNYLAFLLIGVYLLGVGTDIGTPPYSYFYGPALIIVGGIIVTKVWNLYRISKGKAS